MTASGIAAKPIHASGGLQVPLQMGSFPSGAVRSLPAMTAKLIDIRERLLDAADLVVDFATLGEYGLEPAPVHECERRSALPSGSPHHLHDRAGEPERLAA